MIESMEEPTYEEAATSWNLWTVYVDPRGIMTQQEFDAMPTPEKVQLQIQMFGIEINPEEN